MDGVKLYDYIDRAFEDLSSVMMYVGMSAIVAVLVVALAAWIRG